MLFNRGMQSHSFQYNNNKTIQNESKTIPYKRPIPAGSLGHHSHNSILIINILLYRIIKDTLCSRKYFFHQWHQATSAGSILFLFTSTGGRLHTMLHQDRIIVAGKLGLCIPIMKTKSWQILEILQEKLNTLTTCWQI